MSELELDGVLAILNESRCANHPCHTSHASLAGRGYRPPLRAGCLEQRHAIAPRPNGGQYLVSDQLLDWEAPVLEHHLRTFKYLCTSRSAQ